jgi:hypothetical protein
MVQGGSSVVEVEGGDDRSVVGLGELAVDGEGGRLVMQQFAVDQTCVFPVR